MEANRENAATAISSGKPDRAGSSWFTAASYVSYIYVALVLLALLWAFFVDGPTSAALTLVAAWLLTLPVGIVALATWGVGRVIRNRRKGHTSRKERLAVWTAGTLTAVGAVGVAIVASGTALTFG